VVNNIKPLSFVTQTDILEVDVAAMWPRNGNALVYTNINRNKNNINVNKCFSLYISLNFKPIRQSMKMCDLLRPQLSVGKIGN